LFWRTALEEFIKDDLICSIILAGITAELAHKAKLGKRGNWGTLIEKYEKDERIKEKADRIRLDYRNVWVHADIEKMEKHLKIRTTDAELNVALASGDALEALVLTAQFLTMLGYARNQN